MKVELTSDEISIIRKFCDDYHQNRSRFLIRDNRVFILEKKMECIEAALTVRAGEELLRDPLPPPVKP